MSKATDNKSEFMELLRSTEREGIEDVIEGLEKDGFFEAPASAGHHLNVEGGLLEHSLNTCKTALAIWEAMKPLSADVQKIKRESVIIASLLHDVCKTDIYKRTVKKKKTVIGTWEDSEGYKVSYKNFPMGHGEKSVIMLLFYGLEMNDDEMLAIRWHMGAWGINMNSLEEVRNYDTAGIKYPLVEIIHSADSLASKILETSPADDED
ncbi:MAG: HD family phosphohydrolase [Paludibacteraceae bacterium]|nr:HD family phosphohydrolase [Candidatus Physcocola equi]MCQ2233592.1 HD family phosphohydrolase [Paludibacteraceae bacterium]